IRHQIALRLAHSSTVREGLSKSKSPVGLKQIARHATGEELVDALDRLAKRYPATAINLLNERSSNDGLAPEVRSAAFARYFERLIDFDPRDALRRLDEVCRR